MKLLMIKNPRRCHRIPSIYRGSLQEGCGKAGKKSRVLRIRSGFFVIIPLEYRATGILSAEWFIADKNPPITRLDPSLPAGEAERDARWRLLVNTDVEGDL